MGERKMQKETFQLSLTPFTTISHPMTSTRPERVMCPPSCKRIQRSDFFIRHIAFLNKIRILLELKKESGYWQATLALQCLLPTSPSPLQVLTALCSSHAHPTAPSSLLRTALPRPTSPSPGDASPRCSLNSQRPILRSSTVLDRKHQLLTEVPCDQ